MTIGKLEPIGRAPEMRCLLCWANDPKPAKIFAVSVEELEGLGAAPEEILHSTTPPALWLSRTPTALADSVMGPCR